MQSEDKTGSKPASGQTNLSGEKTKMNNKLLPYAGSISQLTDVSVAAEFLLMHQQPNATDCAVFLYFARLSRPPTV